MHTEELRLLKDLAALFSGNNRRIVTNATDIWSNIGWTNEVKTNTLEMCLLLEGNAALNIGGKKLHAQAGDLFFFDNSLDNSCKHGKFTIFGYNYYVADLHGNNNNLYSQLEACHRELSGKLFRVRSSLCRDFCIVIKNEFLQKKEEFELSINTSLLRILIEAIRSTASHAGAGMQNRYKGRSELVADISMHILENLNKDISLPEMGRKYNLSHRYLNNIFKSSVGYPIIQYQLRMKVERAKKLLASSTMTITDISSELNFASSQYFSHIFKKVTGMTPGEYRKSRI